MTASGKRSWAVLAALIFLAAVGYALNRGIYVGKTVEVGTKSTGDLAFMPICRYLFAHGVREARSLVVYSSPSEADHKHTCTALGRS